jgi:hypothetical protein
MIERLIKRFRGHKYFANSRRGMAKASAEAAPIHISQYTSKNRLEHAISCS